MHYSFLDRLLFKIFLDNNIFQEVLFDVDKFFFFIEKKGLLNPYLLQDYLDLEQQYY